MYKPLLFALAAALVAPATASAAWTPPTTLAATETANPVAQRAFDGSVLTGFLAPTAAVSKRLGPLADITAADPFEKVWYSGLDKDGNAVVLTVRKHAPYQRVRAILVTADGARSAVRTISQPGRSASGPVLDVAPDGTAVAAWGWHDPAGWRAQVAIRRPGQPTFGAPRTISAPGPLNGKYQTRPLLHVAAGLDGRAAVTYQFGGSYELPEAPLHVLTAGIDSTFGADQALEGAGGYADADVAIGDSGQVELAWLDEHFTGHPAAPSLHESHGTAGQPLSAPAVLATGGKGTSSGPQVAVDVAADGTPTIAWAKPADKYEDGGTLELIRGGSTQTIAQHAEGIQLDGDALVWMTHDKLWSVHASIGGGPDTVISDPAHNALWPTVAVTPKGDAIAAWVTNDNGGGSGKPTAAIYTP
jgi:hypothetical protein